jgi:DNA-binding MarR family transcriptional regulator
VTRPTGKTLAVLDAIRGDEGISNSGIADACGGADAGQISKLLGRLESAGLIAREAGSHGRGHPNAWMLTPAGLKAVENPDTEIPPAKPRAFLVTRRVTQVEVFRVIALTRREAHEKLDVARKTTVRAA